MTKLKMLGVAVIVLLIAIPAAWIVLSPRVEVTGSRELDSALMEVAESGREVSLSSLMDFEWDQVALFAEGATSGAISGVVGERVLRDSRFYDANLFVFLLDGKVVAALSAYPDVTVGKYGTLFGPTARLVPDEAWSGFVRLTE